MVENLSQSRGPQPAQGPPGSPGAPSHSRNPQSIYGPSASEGALTKSRGLHQVQGPSVNTGDVNQTRGPHHVQGPSASPGSANRTRGPQQVQGPSASPGSVNQTRGPQQVQGRPADQGPTLPPREAALWEPSAARACLGWPDQLQSPPPASPLPPGPRGSPGLSCLENCTPAFHPTDGKFELNMNMSFIVCQDKLSPLLRKGSALKELSR